MILNTSLNSLSAIVSQKLKRKMLPPQHVLIYLGEARKVCASLFYIYFRYWNFQLNNKIMHQTPMEHIRNCMGFGKSSVTLQT